MDHLDLVMVASLHASNAAIIRGSFMGVNNNDSNKPSMAKNVKKKTVEIKSPEIDPEPVHYDYNGDEFRMKAAVRNLIKSANNKLNILVNGYQIKRDYLTLVRIYAIFLKIGEIDNIKERFQADAYIEAYWEDDSIEGNSFDPNIHWKPEIYIENAVANTKQEVKYKVVRKHGKTFVYEMRTIKSVFWERLELWDFPLDIQDISITITTSRSRNEVKFEPSLENECAINTEEFRMQQEWNLYGHIHTSHRVIYDIWKNYDRPAYTISGTISRRPGYYLNNAYMLIFFITILGFVPFSFSVTTPHFRIQTTLLLILSSVNFRWIVTQRLPSVSYLTTLDIYAITALIFLALLCCWHAIIGSQMFADLESSRAFIDLVMLYVIAGLFVFFHFGYCTYFFNKYLRYKKIGKEEGDKSLNILKQLNQFDKRPLSANNIRPMVHRNISAIKPSNSAIHKVNEKEMDGVKYRNLTESPSGSITSYNVNVHSKLNQKNNIKY